MVEILTVRMNMTKPVNETQCSLDCAHRRTSFDSPVQFKEHRGRNRSSQMISRSADEIWLAGRSKNGINFPEVCGLQVRTSDLTSQSTSRTRLVSNDFQHMTRSCILEHYVYLR